MKKQVLLRIQMLFVMVFSLLEIHAQCDFRITSGAGNLYFVEIAPKPSETQEDQIIAFLGNSLDTYQDIVTGVRLNADGVFSPEEVQGVMSILCPENCIFKLYDSSIDYLNISIQPALNSSQIALISEFLGNDFSSSTASTSAVTAIYVTEAFTPEEIQGIFSILCGAQCIFEISSTSDDNTLTVSPLLSQDQIEAIEQKLQNTANPLIDIVNSGQSSFVNFENPYGQQELSAINAVLCNIAPIPTMGEWGILILGLFIVVIAILTLKDKIKKIALSMFSL